MIYLYQNSREYDYDVRAIALAFFEREKIIEVSEDIPDRQLAAAGPGKAGPDDRPLFLKLDFGDQRIEGQLTDLTGKKSRKSIECDYRDHAHCRNAVSRFLYHIFSDFTGRKLPWGMLTGIRPTKIVMKWLEEGMEPRGIIERFSETYLADRQKAALCCRVALKEKEILESHPFEREYSLYIGIPFCPTTCLYCSFASFPLSRFGDRMDPYLDALEKELRFTAGVYREKALTTIYVGGGTPTALSEHGLTRLMDIIHQNFPVSSLKEFTVEAGRPDSVNSEKLKILHEAGVGRISINPQTMHQTTLDLIGRDHTVDQVRQAFALARETGFDNINMDMITGLPGEDIDHVRETLSQLSGLGPESLTVHSLAIKRAAHLNIEMERYQSMVKGTSNDMLRLADEVCSRMGMEPYYMYRQKNIPGNLENIGYSLPGKECLYNILIMEEKQDIISCGAGASTKYVYPEENRIERTENVKNIDHYIQRIDEMIDRKKRYMEMV
ncbi:MAG: coproporphyrinogen dehydrogenase HemZ [Eubacterium sp.]|nr:coproporphyrinogen dehydrogenase HemZ [Eubacterium sp.]